MTEYENIGKILKGTRQGAGMTRSALLYKELEKLCEYLKRRSNSILELEKLCEYLKRRSNSIRDKIGSVDKKNFTFTSYNQGLADGFSLAAELLEAIFYGA